RSPVKFRTRALRVAKARAAVEWRAERIDDAPKQFFADRDPERRAGRLDRRARPDPVQLAERHQQRPARAEADHLGRDGAASALAADHADLADLGLESG